MKLKSFPVILALWGAAAFAQIAGVPVPAPLPAKAVHEQFYGVRVDDPWRYTENTKHPLVAAWMRQHADATRLVLSKIPGREALLARVAEIDAASSAQVGQIRQTDRGDLFFTRREPGENQFKLMMRDAETGVDRVLVDPESRKSSSGQALAVLDFSPSFDGRHLTYTLQVGGSEIGTLHLMDVKTGTDIIPNIDRIRFASVTWLRDHSGFFFSRLREGYESLPDTEKFGDRGTWFYDLKTRQMRMVFSPIRDTSLGLPAFASAAISEIPGTDLVALNIALGVDRNRVLFIGELNAAKSGTAIWRQLFNASDQVRAYALTKDWIYVLTAKSAPRHQLLRMPLQQPDLVKAQVLVPPSDEVLVSLATAKDAAYLVKRTGAAMRLFRIDHVSAEARQISLPFEGSVGLAFADESQDGLILSLTGWTRAISHYRLQANRNIMPLGLARAGAFDAPAELVAREAMVKAADGVSIPVSIISRRDLTLDRNNPTILYGYGAYGITENPGFNPRLLALIERGGVFVFAHVRGGGIYGTEWHLAGQKATKANTWRDGIAVARWLIEEGYTSPEKLGIYGGSAGGIFVGMAINERPELFAAAVPAVPVMDMIRFELDPNGLANIPEFGTVKNQQGFESLLAMSSYHQLRSADYPAVMLVHGVNDTRVSVWQSIKYANRLMHLSQSGRPVLMRLDYQLGHGGGSTRRQQQEQTVDIWSFMLWQMGLPDFQPKSP